jgi:para-nitrobenzyl esterase
MNLKSSSPILVVVALAACEAAPQQTAPLDSRADMQTADRGPITPGPDGPASSEVPFQQGIAVTTASGKVTGVKSGGLRVFKGVPYAEPPVGALRLRAPVPVKPWTQTLQATAFGPACPQESLLVAGAASMSEDCLTLNIWAHDNATAGYPVMFWIHGGAFTLASSAQAMWEASNLATDGKVVVVSINYRLGALGFLAIPELKAEDPQGRVGNLGIQDQVEALRWVKKNIRAFGGDPGNVTVFGESAGGISLCALLGAPAADGLYQRGISESGTGCNLFLKADEKTAYGAPAFAQGAEYLKKLGCADAPDRLACLRKLPAEEFPKLWAFTDLMGGSMALSLWPVVDGAFIPKIPLERMRAGEAPKLDFIFGSNQDEGSLFSMSQVIVTRDELRKKFLQFGGGDEALADKLMNIYNAVDFPLPKNAYVAAMGEVIFGCGTLAAAQTMGKRGRVYYFQKAPVAIDLLLGTMHAVDVLYVFGSFGAMGLIPSLADLAVEATVQKAWSSFARTGTPDFPIAWPPYDAGAPSVVSIDTIPTLVTSFRGGRCDKLRALGLVP